MTVTIPSMIVTISAQYAYPPPNTLNCAGYTSNYTETIPLTQSGNTFTGTVQDNYGPCSDICIGGTLTLSTTLQLQADGTTLVGTLTYENKAQLSDPTFGPGTNDSTASGSITLASGPATLVITKPVDQAVFDYTGSYISTDPINFQAMQSPTSPAAVSWSAALQYATSSGRGAYTSRQTFTTLGPAVNAVAYQSTGGMITLNAAATLNGQLINATPVTLYVTGTNIPSATITPLLVSRYSGPTQNLLVGIALTESSEQQFRQLTLYGQSALWPNESAKDGGSHIGLMQLGTADNEPTDYWNWQENATDGANFFQEKMDIAKNLVARIRKSHPSLPDLTGLQYEQYAVELYGDHPGTYFSQQYWVAMQTDPADPKSAWVWQLGTANPLGAAYVASVYSNTH